MGTGDKITTNILVNLLNDLIGKERFELYYIDEYHHFYNDQEFEIEYILLYDNKCILQYNRIYKSNSLDFELVSFDEAKKEFETSFNRKLFREILYSRANENYMVDLNLNSILTIGDILNEFNNMSLCKKKDKIKITNPEFLIDK